MKQSTKAAFKTRTRSQKADASARTRAAKSATAKIRTGRDTGTKMMGVTVPKTLAHALDNLISSPRGREILASALLAAASAAAAALTKGSDQKEVPQARQAAADAGKQLTQDLSEAAAGVVAGIVTEAARSLLPTSLTREIKNEGS
jgi:hypothetical protein